MAQQTQQRKQFKRNPATRMLIGEIKNTMHELPKTTDDQYESQMYLSPTGAETSRIMVVGAAIEKENVGKETPFWRMRVADSSGSIYVYAGQYQPEAAQKISQLELPAFVAVVGKISRYEAEGQAAMISIRPESISIVDEATRGQFAVDAAEQTVARIKHLQSNAALLEQLQKAYPRMQIRDYALLATQAVESLIADIENEKTQEAPAPAPTPVPGTPKPANKKGKTQEMSLSEVVYRIIRDHDTGQGTKLDTIQEALRIKGYRVVDWEAAVKKLKNDGMCYEIKNGALKAI